MYQDKMEAREYTFSSTQYKAKCRFRLQGIEYLKADPIFLVAEHQMVGAVGYFSQKLELKPNPRVFFKEVIMENINPYLTFEVLVDEIFDVRIKYNVQRVDGENNHVIYYVNYMIVDSKKYRDMLDAFINKEGFEQFLTKKIAFAMDVKDITKNIVE